MFAGHIKVFGGPHVARGPDVAQACSRVSRIIWMNPETFVAQFDRTFLSDSKRKQNWNLTNRSKNCLILFAG